MNKEQYSKFNCLENINYPSLLNKNNSKHISEMSSDNFIFIYYPKKTIEDKENLKKIFDHVGMDACFKLGYLAVESNLKVPTITFCFQNKNLVGEIAFFANIYPFNYTNLMFTIINISNFIEKIYLEVFKINRIFNPVFTIDKGAVEIATLNKLGLHFVLCRWHCFTAIRKKLIKASKSCKSLIM